MNDEDCLYEAREELDPFFDDFLFAETPHHTSESLLLDVPVAIPRISKYSRFFQAFIMPRLLALDVEEITPDQVQIPEELR